MKRQVHCSFRQLQHGRAQGRELANEFIRLPTKFLRREDLVDEAHRLGFRRVDDVSGQQQFQRAVPSHKPGENDRRHRRKHSHLDLRLAESGSLGRDDHVAKGGQFTAAAERHPVDERHRGQSDGMKEPEHPVKLFDHFRYFVRRVVANGDTGGKCLSLVVDRENLHVLLRLNARDGIMDFAEHGDVDDIQGRQIEADPGNSVFDCAQDASISIRHRVNPHSS